MDNTPPATPTDNKRSFYWSKRSAAIGGVVGAVATAALSVCTGPYCSLMKAILPSLLALFTPAAQP